MDDRLPTFTVKLISKYADMDVAFEGVRGKDADDAGNRCLAMMARPEAWLVVSAQ